MRVKKALITGITGFVGPHLANLIVGHGVKVIGLLRGSNGRQNDIRDVVPDRLFKKMDFVIGDLRDRERIFDLIGEIKPDYCFHLAAQSHPPTSFANPHGTFQDNIIGSENLIDAVVQKRPECMFMFCSTSEVYGNSIKNGQEINETAKLDPANPYGVSKAATDLYVQERIANAGLNGFITRAFSHTGPRRGMMFSISSDAYQLARIALGLQKPVLRVGNLKTIRVVMDVRDVVSAYWAIANVAKSNERIFNVCGKTPLEMGEYTKSLISISGQKVKTVKDPKLYRTHDIWYQKGNTSRLKSLGWSANLSIGETLKDLFNYWLLKIGG